MPAYKKLIALDFDGVIHQYVQPWTTELEIRDPPMPGAFEFILSLLENGYEVAVVSSRNRSIHHQQMMSDWFLLHGFPLDKLTELLWPNHKPPAYMTIDDRALKFEGRWPSLTEIENFKPWKISATQP